jgi:hypothetical protein
MFTKLMTSALPMAIFATGCMTEADGATDGDGDQAAVAEAEQALTGNGSYSWGDTKYSYADIGSGAGRACFMSGIAGYLTTNKFPEGTTQAGAGVDLDPATNRYKIYVDPAFSGVTLQTWARCANASNITPEVTWRAGQPKAILAPVAGTRRCFITSLTTGRDGEFPHGGFQSLNDGVWVGNDGTNWYINGSQSGLVWASARCIDVTEDLGQFYNWANEGTTNTRALVPATSGATCFLTQVSGKLTTSNDWEAGPHVVYNAAYNYFDFTSKNGNGGYVRCVR